MTFKFFTAKEFTPISPMCSGREAACTIIYDIYSGGCPATSTAATSSCAGPGAGPSDAARRRRCSCLFSA